MSYTHLYTTSNKIKDFIELDVRLACVKHLDSVHSEPSSNSTNMNPKVLGLKWS